MPARGTVLTMLRLRTAPAALAEIGGFGALLLPAWTVIGLKLVVPEGAELETGVAAALLRNSACPAQPAALSNPGF